MEGLDKDLAYPASCRQCQTQDFGWQELYEKSLKKGLQKATVIERRVRILLASLYHL